MSLFISKKHLMTELLTIFIMTILGQMSKEAQTFMWAQGVDSGIQSGYTTAAPSVKGPMQEDEDMNTQYTFEWETGFGNEHMDAMNDQFNSTRRFVASFLL